jgi:uncharacterized membrane protein
MISNRIKDSTLERLNFILTIILAFALVASLGGVVYVAITPSAQEDPFTEFYILGSGGKAADYPTNLTTGETGEFIVGITNNEHEDLTYTVALVLEDETIEERQVEVEDGETWEEEFSFTVEEPGENQLDILLFVGEDVGAIDDSYRELRLIIEVRE